MEILIPQSTERLKYALTGFFWQEKNENAYTEKAIRAVREGFPLHLFSFKL